MLRTKIQITLFLLICLGAFPKTAVSDVITVINAGFEDTTGHTVFNEFTFGTPPGWTRYDPNMIVPNSGVTVGTLLPNGTQFFDTTAPEGDRVSIFFNSSSEGMGEYGIEQTLATTLQPNGRYTLSVEVGNIASGTASNGAFFNLDEFPGYRVDLLAGGSVISSDQNTLDIPEAEWRVSTVGFTTGATHAQMGQNLGIRLVNLNAIPAGFTQATSPDLEVDFDNVRLDLTAVPEPTGGLAFLVASLWGIRRRRRRD